jgi:hypothetical protein
MLGLLPSAPEMHPGQHLCHAAHDWSRNGVLVIAISQ